MPFMRGCRPSPRHKLLAATPFRPIAAVPAEFATVPKQLSVWGNSTYGDCVTAEEAFAKACWSVQCGLPELFVPESEVIRWAGHYGFLNGADLSEVMDTMGRDGLNVGGVNYKDGGKQGVDYSNETVLQAAIATGPVKIAIDADALPSGAGNGNGWFATSGGRYSNTDHCVGLSGYGRADYLYDQLQMSVPGALSPSTLGRLLFTWSTIGFVTQDWLMGTCTEAWVRTPTTPGQSPAPVPTPTPVPVPVPPAPIPTPGVWQQIIAFVQWLISLLHPANHTPEVAAAFAQAGVPAGGPVIDIIKALIAKLISNAPALVAIVVADLAAGKTYVQILIDLLAALKA